MIKTFADGLSPGHLLSSEVLANAKARMTDDGVLATNIIGNVRPDSPFVPAATRAVAAHFSNVAAFPVFDIGVSDQPSGNIVLLARNGDLPRACTPNSGPVHWMAEDGVCGALRQWGSVKIPQGDILTGDFNPLDVLDIGLYEWIRATILKITPSNILLYS